MKLVIEVDGASHDGRFEYDMERQQMLESTGLTVLRFNDIDVKRDIDGVVTAIEKWVEGNNPPTPFSKGELPSSISKGELPCPFNSTFVKGKRRGCVEDRR